MPAGGGGGAEAEGAGAWGDKVLRSIAASRLARAGAARASGRAVVAAGAPAAEGLAGARRKVKAGLIAVQAVGCLARAG